MQSCPIFLNFLMTMTSMTVTKHDILRMGGMAYASMNSCLGSLKNKIYDLHLKVIQRINETLYMNESFQAFRFTGSFVCNMLRRLG